MCASRHTTKATAPQRFNNSLEYLRAIDDLGRLRSQLELLASASAILAPAVEDPQRAIAGIADVFVPEYADYFAAYLAGTDGDGGLAEAAMECRDDGVAACVDHAVTPDVLRDAMAATESSIHHANACVWVLSPIRIRGLALGVMVIAVRDTRPMAEDDRRVIDELAARTAMALERSMLYADARRAVAASERRATQLGQLIEAAIAFNRSLHPSELLEAVTEQAALLLEADRASAWLATDEGSEAEYGIRHLEPARAGAAIVAPDGQPIGYLSVERSALRPFEPDAATVLTLLARLASVAAHNAHLYDDLRNRERRLQALIEASPLMILELDRAGGVESRNEAARVLPEPLPEEVVSLLRQLVAAAGGGQAVDAELTTTNRDGERLDVWISVALLAGDVPRVAGALAVISDVTARRRLEGQLVETRRSEAVAQVAGGVAHDFNNLLTVIVGYSEMLLRTLDDDRPERDDIAAIHEAGRHAALITNQLLALSRSQRLRPVLVNAAESARRLQAMLGRLAGGRVSIEVHGDTDATVRMDGGQFEQVLMNLVLNSRDAMPEGGTITVTIDERTSSNGEQLVAVTVADDGEGMDAATLERCREPFFTTKARSHSTGLGLATVTSIMESVGGTLEIQSETGKGTSITAQFPRVVGVTTVSDGEPEQRIARVLIVDDDEGVRFLAERVLAEAGFLVTAVGDAESALVRAEVDGDFDLLLSDIVLPGMSGVGLARTFMQRWPDTARLLMTGYAGRDSGTGEVVDTAVVNKPFSADDLVRAARAALDQRAQAPKR